MTIRDLILHALAVIVAIACLMKVWLTHTWENSLVELLLGFGGLVAFLFPYEFSSWQGYQAWRTNQWRFQPEGWVRFTGAVMLGVCAFSVLVKQVEALHRP
jgi:hypothetical protein